MVGRPVVVKRIRAAVGTPDRYGNSTPGVETESDLPPALFAPRDVIPAPEPGRLPVVVEPSLYWRNLWPDVVASDRLRVAGVVYAVLTVPANWQGATVGGLVVKLRDVTEGVP